MAIDLASRLEYKNKVWVLIVENTFTSIPDMAKILLKWRCLNWLPMFCHKNKVSRARSDVLPHVMRLTVDECRQRECRFLFD